MSETFEKLQMSESFDIPAWCRCGLSLKNQLSAGYEEDLSDSFNNLAEIT